MCFQLEQEVSKVHRAHEELVASCDRRERLEKAARNRLQGELRRLQELNQGLREQGELLTSQLLSSRAASPDHSRKELSKREALIAQLVTQSEYFTTFLATMIYTMKLILRTDLIEDMKPVGWLILHTFRI